MDARGTRWRRRRRVFSVNLARARVSILWFTTRCAASVHRARRLMHPPLTLDKHPLCREKVIALTTCHREKALTKFIGACNDEKWALDACLRAQKLHKARKNQEKARASKERLRARLERERA